ncbi:MAG: MYXO-CTERM sorting domain-containing protein [Pseudomonadota bacterium]
MREALVAAAACVAMISTASAAVFTGPTAYKSFDDSPFASLTFSYFYLEDFEDGAFNTQGARPSDGWATTIPSGFVDSVDADDGAIDGSGSGGTSYFSQFAQDTLTIFFDSEAPGGLPTHAGLVWTDVNGAAPNTVIFSAIGADGSDLGSIGPTEVGDNAIRGETDEDRFFGVSDLGGILSITIFMPNRNNWEIDHVQYGVAAANGATPIPVPAALPLFLAGLGGLLFARRGHR